jgi:hypothetical protein
VRKVLSPFLVFFPVYILPSLFSNFLNILSQSSISFTTTSSSTEEGGKVEQEINIGRGLRTSF